jgi:hypothetical protein
MFSGLDVACGGHAFLINKDLFLKIKRILNVVRLNAVDALMNEYLIGRFS